MKETSSLLDRTRSVVLASRAVKKFQEGLKANSAALLPGEPEMFLRMGDQVSLYSEEGCGFLSSEGYLDNDCFLEPGTHSDPPPNFMDSVFMVLPRYKYDAHSAYSDTLDRWNRARDSVKTDDTEDKHLLQLRVSEHRGP